MTTKAIQTNHATFTVGDVLLWHVLMGPHQGTYLVTITGIGPRTVTMRGKHYHLHLGPDQYNGTEWLWTFRPTHEAFRATVRAARPNPVLTAIQGPDITLA